MGAQETLKKSDRCHRQGFRDSENSRGGLVLGPGWGPGVGRRAGLGMVPEQGLGLGRARNWLI